MPLDYYQNLMEVAGLAALAFRGITLRCHGVDVTPNEALLLALGGHVARYNAPADTHDLDPDCVPGWALHVQAVIPPGMATSLAVLLRSLQQRHMANKLASAGLRAAPTPPSTFPPNNPGPGQTTVHITDPCDPHWTPAQISEALGQPPRGCTCAAHWKAFKTHATRCPLNGRA
jgi:hypothetical protein